MKKFLLGCIFLSFFCQAQSKVDTNLVTGYIKTSHIERSLEQIKNSFWNSFISSFGKEKDTLGLFNAFQNSFNSKLLTEEVRKVVIKNYNEQAIREFITWSNSPVAVKLDSLDSVELGEEYDALLTSMTINICQNRIGGRTLKYVEKIVDKTGMNDLVVDIIIEATNILIDKLSAKLPSGKRKEANNFKNDFANQIKAASPYYKCFMTAYIYQNYKTLFYSELDSILSFYESRTGQWFAKVQRESYSRIIKTGMVDFSNKIAEKITVLES